MAIFHRAMERVSIRDTIGSDIDIDIDHDVLLGVDVVSMLVVGHGSYWGGVGRVRCDAES